ncbi:putative Thyrotropin-releasing hormone-degrading ectoenzyme, partial [Hypsibius exemplaris]
TQAKKLPDFSCRGQSSEKLGLRVYPKGQVALHRKSRRPTRSAGVRAIIARCWPHMIFGNLLTCQWWSDTWLDEGFARFIAVRVMYRTKPRWNLGASILHMIKGLMQETPFFNALKQVPGGDSEPDYDAPQNDISYTQKRFLLPVAPGSSAPVLTRHTWDVPLTLISGAFKDDLQAALQAANRPCWVSSASEKLPDRCLTIFTEKPTVVAGTDQTSNFIIANVQQFGFYRVNYDISNWNRIIRALGAYTSGADQRNVLHDVHTRGQLIDDSFNLARADQLGTGNQYEIPLRLINIYLTKEQSYGPLASAMDNLRYIDQMLRGTPDYPQFAGYMQNLAGQLYKKSMWETNWKDSWTTADQESESSYGTLMFNTLVIETACFYGVSDCLTEADTRFAAWVARGKDRAFTADERPPMKI